MKKFGVALYTDGKFEGVVFSSAKIESKADARSLAERWDRAHAGLHDYRPVEVDDAGALVWEGKKL